MSESAEPDAVPSAGPLPVAGSALAAFALGIGAILALPLSTPLAPMWAVGAILAGIASRRRLRNDPSVRGSRLSVAGFLLGIVAAVISFVPFWLPLLFTALNPATYFG
ncbi:hypothetical protein [Glaciibacter psychrotolerans]|uniref:DUF4190 domain-containing protein n=1 Tax=Glaciibacter psychrotolerans TaxID=670054 RepID=A0A7Z0ECA9_9MICO|nr:hypothetical protein [Leifsonia psychrotolerans]NYJ19016.1 hypothetical protein [Leifsonia psychrotolerans]